MQSLVREMKRTVRAVIRRRHRAAILPRASVVFMSPQKCGRTWVRAMISHCYHLTYGTSAQELIAYDNFHKVDARIPIMFFTHIGDEPPAILRRLNPTALAGQTVIALIRDPRDAAVSRYFQEEYRVRHDTADSADGAEPSESALYDFLILHAFGLQYYISLIKILQSFGESHSNFHIFTYEQVKNDPGAALALLMLAMGTDLPVATVDAAVAFASFDNLKRREAEGYFTSSKLRPGNPNEPNSFKVRKGKVGGYREHFSAAELASIDALVAGADLRAFGYTGGEATQETRG
jgi:hypothetical protein